MWNYGSLWMNESHLYSHLFTPLGSKMLQVGTNKETPPKNLGTRSMCGLVFCEVFEMHSFFWGCLFVSFFSGIFFRGHSISGFHPISGGLCFFCCDSVTRTFQGHASLPVLLTWEHSVVKQLQMQWLMANAWPTSE